MLSILNRHMSENCKLTVSRQTLLTPICSQGCLRTESFINLQNVRIKIKLSDDRMLYMITGLYITNSEFANVHKCNQSKTVLFSISSLNENKILRQKIRKKSSHMYINRYTSALQCVIHYFINYLMIFHY
jgi:predicted HTH transcriptional regulator